MGGFDFDENENNENDIENQENNNDELLKEELLEKKGEEKIKFNDNCYWKVDLSTAADELADCLRDLEL